MLLVLFLLFSIPIGCFSTWFAFKAHAAGKKNIVYAMALMAVMSFSSALVVVGWGYLFISG